jgi:protein-export SecD/SecF family membrane protein
MRQSPGAFLAVIALLAVLAGVFVFPQGYGAEFRPWRLGLDLVGGSHLVYRIDLSQVQEGDRQSVLNGLRDVIERRVNLFGVAEPQIFIAKSGGESELVVELAGVQNVADAIRQIGETPLLDFREVEVNGSSTNYVLTNLNGRYISGAQLGFGGQLQQPQVEIQFNEEGGKIFEQITAANVGKPLAIFLDRTLITAPVVQTKISGGSAVITGQFTIEEARQLVERFNAGALPAPIMLVDQLTVSPSLGSASLSKALVAGVIGTILVMLFMILYYGLFGMFAAVALVIYILLTLSVFKLVPVTLTLAGLAGFIMTIGMAVDANILIFERIKEETKKGLSRSAAIREGFLRAWPSIRDSNTSTIITAVILYFFTSSFVKGFALTLLIGVITSLFSAITTTRLFLRVFVRDHKQPLPSS